MVGDIGNKTVRGHGLHMSTIETAVPVLDPQVALVQAAQPQRSANPSHGAGRPPLPPHRSAGVEHAVRPPIALPRLRLGRALAGQRQRSTYKRMEDA